MGRGYERGEGMNRERVREGRGYERDEVLKQLILCVLI